MQPLPINIITIEDAVKDNCIFPEGLIKPAQVKQSNFVDAIVQLSTHMDIDGGLVFKMAMQHYDHIKQEQLRQLGLYSLSELIRTDSLTYERLMDYRHSYAYLQTYTQIMEEKSGDTN